MKKHTLKIFVPQELRSLLSFRAMTLVFFLLFACVIQLHAVSAQSQNALITLRKSNVDLLNIMGDIEKQSNYLFVYNKEVNVHRQASINVNQQPLGEVLQNLFNNSDVRFAIEGSYIVLSSNKQNDAKSVAQSRINISGTVTSTDNEPMPGVTIMVKGTNTGAITNVDGKYTIEVPSSGSVLVFSFIGYQKVEQAVGNQRVINVVLNEDVRTIDEVVVTALGIKKKEKSLTYSTQVVGGDELIRAKDPNMINSLAGKTAGVQINRSSSGLGGSVKMVIRGSRSVTGSNQPLYVIDGVPINSSANDATSTTIGGNNDSGNRDGGDGISNLNPDDIESMNILKGPAAAALYGSSAANGVVVITTKKGKVGRTNITFSSNTTWENAAYGIPEFQNSYGGVTSSWGDKISGSPDYTKDFFQTGVTTINSLSLSAGSEMMQTYFSYANTTAKGIVEKNKMQKHNLNFRETANFFNDYLKLDANVNLMTQTIKNRPTSGGYYMNPLVGLYGFPRGEDLSEYKNNFEVFDPARNMNVQNWYTSYQDMEQNPYWITNRINSNDKRTRAIASLTANVKITDWLNIQARGTADYTHDQYQQRMYASTAPALAGQNGRYIDLNHTETLYYGDVMAMVNKKWNDFSLNGAIGGSINSTNVNSLRLDSKTASLYYPNVFTVANIKMTQAAYIDEQMNQKRVLQSLFGTAQLGWKESLYLDVTARNDWSSTLAYTKHSSFFYPSVGLSWVLNNTVKLPEWISFGKIRGSWSKVGNDLPLFISNTIPGSNDIIGAGGAIVTYSKAPFNDLKPEMSTSYEIGTEWRFFNYRLDFDITYYRTNTKNQLFTLPSSAGADYKYYMVNAGNIQNEGVEITLGATPVMNDAFRWKTQFNFSTNKNKIIKLHPDLKTFVYGDESFSSSYSMRLVEGGSFGDIYGKAFERDENGRVAFTTDKDGDKIPNVIGGGNTEKVGNCNPDFMLGWSNTFTYKGFSLYFLIDGRFGGDVLSQTQAELDQRGVSLNSGKARDAGYINIDGTQVKPRKFYTAVSGRDGCTEYYMYDATNIRLRELSLGYSLPQSWLAKAGGAFKDVQLSFVARNLFFISKKAPFDPDAVLSTGNDNQGIDVFGMPTTRSLGFNIKFTF